MNLIKPSVDLYSAKGRVRAAKRACSLLDNNELQAEVTADGEHVVFHPCCVQWLVPGTELPTYPISYILDNYNSDTLYEFLCRQLDILKEMQVSAAMCRSPRVCRSLPVYNSRNLVGMQTLTVSTSRKCNLRCKMCDARATPTDSELALTELMLNSIKGKHIECIKPTIRGEPFTLDYFYDWCLDLNATDAKLLRILTNGTLLLPADIQKLYDSLTAKGVQLGLGFSLDATTPELYEQIRGIDAFDQVVSNIRLCKELGILEYINYVALPGVNEHELPTLKTKFKEIGLIEPCILVASFASAVDYKTDSLKAILDFNLVLNLSEEELRAELNRRAQP